MLEKTFDCIVVGGGPSGLTAALYLARFRRRVLVVHDGNSRAQYIPEFRNFPAVSLSGSEFLNRLLRELSGYWDVPVLRARANALRQQGDRFLLECGPSQFVAHRIFMATGLSDIAPIVDGLPLLVYEGAIRFCPICDAYEASDKNIGLLAASEDSWTKALFLRTYSRRVTLLKTHDLDISEVNRRALSEAGVTVVDIPVAKVAPAASGTRVRLADGQEITFDVLYPALGCEVHSTLATALGAEHDDFSCLKVDSHQETSIKGLYAGGDVVSDLHQVAVAVGHAAVAATAIHNSLPRSFRQVSETSCRA